MKAVILKRAIPGPRPGTRILEGARIKVSDAEAARLIGARIAYEDNDFQGMSWRLHNSNVTSWARNGSSIYHVD